MRFVRDNISTSKYRLKEYRTYFVFGGERPLIRDEPFLLFYVFRMHTEEPLFLSEISEIYLFYKFNWIVQFTRAVHKNYYVAFFYSTHNSIYHLFSNKQKNDINHRRDIPAFSDCCY